jgi:hypothetical protein
MLPAGRMHTDKQKSRTQYVDHVFDAAGLPYQKQLSI